ncbi:hypothetical protein DUI87_29875 [Hirundo rustica rustica]|uniref:Uncharacterized protein n=1 Tax=Hirundo rustica rustica TaxID=333673 RepID=A0A3M0IYM3_HIRRU|nr:hypothetical protein DUI87_29875 [Hirundo rustica rustica]
MQSQKAGAEPCVPLIPGVPRAGWATLCLVVPKNGTRGNGENLGHGKFPLNVRKNFFPVSVTEHWDRSLREGSLLRKMTAGSVSVPQIIPLRIPPPGKAQREIDTNTLIEIKSDTPGASIYYTLDGSKPELIRKRGYGACNTLEYKGPIILPVGKIMVKALAVTKDYRESSIVTKVFVVEYQQPNIVFPIEDDDKNFLKDMATQMAPCLECRHLVPMKTPTCIICESPIAPQLQPKTNTCIKPMFGGDSCPPLLGQQRKMAQCSKCNGMNQSNARFCAWCGAKARASAVYENKPAAATLQQCHTSLCKTPPGPPPSYFTCSKCGTSNQPYARFCMSCGVYIEPPSRQSSPGSPMDPGDSLGSSQAKQLKAQVAWQSCPVSFPKSRSALTEKEDKGTQTIGLFYPSSKLLEKKEFELISQKEKGKNMSDRKPLLTAISPGKGYWRKQLDHVCAHVRSYAQNSLEFRTLIGEPQMGKINYATISEDDYEVTITLNFAINKVIHPNRAVKFSNDYLSAGTEVTNEQDGSQTNFGRDDHNLFYSRGKIKRTKSTTFMEQEYKLSPESRQLLDELSRTGKGRISFIEQLLSDGADPNSLSEEERPALTVAVLNKHTGAISPLVQKGADIDQQSGPHNNTALHEAVLLGLEGEECIRALLCCNANVQKKNAAGHSALDLAVAAGDNKVISLFQVSLDREH